MCRFRSRSRSRSSTTAMCILRAYSASEFACCALSFAFFCPPVHPCMMHFFLVVVLLLLLPRSPPSLPFPLPLCLRVIHRLWPLTSFQKPGDSTSSRKLARRTSSPKSSGVGCIAPSQQPSKPGTGRLVFSSTRLGSRPPSCLQRARPYAHGLSLSRSVCI